MRRRLPFVLAVVDAATLVRTAPLGAADLSRTAARRRVERSVHQTYADLTVQDTAGNVTVTAVS